MGSRWPVVVCLCMVTVTSLAAVVPSPETLVITKSDNSSSGSVSSTLPDATTEGPLPPIKLLEMHVVSEVNLRYSHTSVTTQVKNPAKRAQETVFRVLLPETAFISGFTMTIDGKKYEAYVKEKQEAKQIYTDAVSQGIGAAHIATKARDSNHFTVSVNVEPNSVAIFNLTYEELLTRRNSLYSQSLNLNPGSLVANMTVTVHIKEEQKIATVRVPEITTGNEITPTDGSSENTKAVITRSADDREVTVVFKPDLDEQKRLMEIYAQKSKESRSNTRGWYLPEKEQEPIEGVLGQFVVQYDVTRPEGNEVLVNDGYFVHFFAPTDLPPLEKHVVFVLDTSGSMMGRKIEQLREAMQLILGELHQGDYFSIVEFSSGVTVHDLRKVDQVYTSTTPKPYYYFYEREKKPVKLIPPFPATTENIAKAKIVIGGLQADGGTNIDEALSVATDLVHRGVGWKESILSADVANNNASVETKTDINTEKENNMKLEPMIIFLTDGEPTIGESDPKRIISRFIEKNYGERKASTFSLAFGDDADGKFLRKLSLNNNGFSRHIYEAADAVMQLRDFYRQVTSPLLAHVKFTYAPNQVKEDSVTKSRFRTYYAGSEIVVAGRIDDTASEILPIVTGFCGVDEGFARVRKLYEIRPRIIVKKEKQGYLPLERLWAYLTIKQLLDQRDAAEDFTLAKDKKEAPEKQALQLALKYSFVTDLTSLVVVKPNETKAVNAESVDKPEFESYGGGGGVHFAPLSLPAAPAAFGSHALIGTSFLNNRFGDSGQSLINQAQLFDSYDINAPESDLVSGNAITTPFTLILSTTEPPSSSVNVYNLEEYPWTRSLLNSSADELVIQVNGTDIHLKLAIDVNAPETLAEAGTCSVSTAGTAGSCVYLTHCEAAKNITADLYSTTYCLIENQYAGVCCPNVDSAASSNTAPDTTVPATESSSGQAS